MVIFESDKRYVFDKETYYKECERLGMEIHDWTITCDQREVEVITGRTGFVNIGDDLYIVLAKWCKERESKVRRMIIKEGEL